MSRAHTNANGTVRNISSKKIANANHAMIHTVRKDKLVQCVQRECWARTGASTAITVSASRAKRTSPNAAVEVTLAWVAHLHIKQLTNAWHARRQVSVTVARSGNHAQVIRGNRRSQTLVNVLRVQPTQIKHLPTHRG